MESAPKTVNSSAVGALPPLPAENVTSLKNALQIGKVEVTPLGIVATRLDLVRSLDPADWRRKVGVARPSAQAQEHLRDRYLRALEPRFVREQASTPDRSTIATSQGQGINLFPLAVDSEWSIVGQDFTALKPGESLETLIASEPGAA